MKKILFLLSLLFLCAILSGVTFDRGERKIRTAGRSDTFDKVEIVVPVTNRVLAFAAAELQHFLKQGAGINAPVVKAPTGGKLALILGDNALSRAAGLDVKKLATEGFFIKRSGNHIFLLGEDDPDADPRKNRWRMWMKRGTLTAVYDFLERFAGVRFYFPGEMGTVVPRGRD
jgi:hypothetical protein